MVKLVAFASWPSEFVNSLVRKSLLKSLPDVDINFYTSPEEVEALAASAPESGLNILQWSTYDVILHELTLKASLSSQSPSPLRVLSSSYTIRKALIRKHFLHQQTFVNYLTKHPESPLTRAVPKTWSIDIAFADELDELWADELYDLGELIDVGNEHEESALAKWWILKPGMADRGMGIRLFRTRDELLQIFQSFEEDESSDEEEETGEEISKNSDEDEGNTRVSTSQLRHFVIQEYLSTPLLLDPASADIAGGAGSVKSTLGAGKKFHLRVYCVAIGALKVFFSPNILALFAALPYKLPGERTRADPEHQRRTSANEDHQSEAETTSSQIGEIDLARHLTNTCLQHDNPDTERSVRLLSELVGCTVYSENPAWNGQNLTQSDVDDIVNQVSVVLGETFTAALASPVHFQPLPNAFELFGVDFLVSHGEDGKLVVSILELNAEPAIEMTGPRLGWILDELFDSIAKTCVHPYFHSSMGPSGQDGWGVGETRDGLHKCLEVQVRERGG
ncbi:hypothetical protein M407DRAFT_236568 [Tulasnella calospora MUT 4182]|uniref:Tubulin-tyrosine ligase n=1 Tax=Tulasnella calospora MUT 4182 TaxID=1051891 RepID=A0A0C3LWJ5_9AGAM|nr:hypothetical protein M407DRAFT_236568 [Tulasnella calospora MUT 4182]